VTCQAIFVNGCPQEEMGRGWFCREARRVSFAICSWL